MSDEPEIVNRTLSWCLENRHDKCPRTYRRFYVDNRTNKPVYLEQVVCQCPKRGCKCYVPAKERPKKRRTTKRKGK